MPSYQSPIKINKNNNITIHQKIKTSGCNHGSCYNEHKKIFEVNDNIIIKINNIKYKLIEYHFHICGEHNINDKIYDSEVHFVFIEVTNTYDHDKYKNHNICGGEIVENVNTLVIGRMISNKSSLKNLKKLNVKIPSSYYEYDGSLTAGTYAPVRWIVGEHDIKLNLEEIKLIAKSSRKLQPLDGRIILYSK